MNVGGSRRSRGGAAARVGRRLLVPLGGLLAACQSAPADRAAVPERAIAAYYEAYAAEERGVCLQPYMDAITAVRAVEEGAGRRSVRVRYFYRDRFKTERENAGTCIGFAERTFTLVPADGDPPGGWRVAEMSGPSRRS